MAALACILWLLWFDEKPPWVRPRPGRFFEQLQASTATNLVNDGRAVYLRNRLDSRSSQPSKRSSDSSLCIRFNAC